MCVFVLHKFEKNDEISYYITTHTILYLMGEKLRRFFYINITLTKGYPTYHFVLLKADLFPATVYSSAV